MSGPTPLPVGLERPSPEVARDRETTYAEAARVLADHLHPDGLRVSPLGAAWSSDVDAYLRANPDPEVLRAAGWLPLDPLLRRLGRTGADQWAVVADGRVVGRVDLEVGRRPDPVAHLLARCRREGPGPRQEAELARLRADGHRVPDRLPQRSPLRTLRAQVGRVVRPVRAVLGRRRRVVLALSGVDGSGKSTLTAEVLGALERLGVPASRVWVRPGMLSPAIDGGIRLAKRALGRSPKPGLHAAARGRASRLPSRRGLLGRLWVTVVVEEFVRGVRRCLRRSEGVVVFDRHRRDAEVTLRLFYDLDADDPYVRLARRALPDPDLDVHLVVAPEVSLARKQEAVVGSWAVEHQVELYDEILAPGARDDDPVLLDATRTPDEIALHVLTLLLDPTSSDPAKRHGGTAETSRMYARDVADVRRGRAPRSTTRPPEGVA